MYIQFFKYKKPFNSINNEFDNIYEAEGNFRENISIINPVILLEFPLKLKDINKDNYIINSSGISIKAGEYNVIYVDKSTLLYSNELKEKYDFSINGCFINDFNRYYFIDNIEFISSNLAYIYLSVNPLMSFREKLINQEYYVLRNEFYTNKLLEDDELIMLDSYSSVEKSYTNPLSNNYRRYKYELYPEEHDASLEKIGDRIQQLSFNQMNLLIDYAPCNFASLDFKENLTRITYETKYSKKIIVPEKLFPFINMYLNSDKVNLDEKNFINKATMINAILYFPFDLLLFSNNMNEDITEVFIKDSEYINKTFFNIGVTREEVFPTLGELEIKKAYELLGNYIEPVFSYTAHEVLLFNDINIKLPYANDFRRTFVKVLIKLPWGDYEELPETYIKETITKNELNLKITATLDYASGQMFFRIYEKEPRESGNYLIMSKSIQVGIHINFGSTNRQEQELLRQQIAKEQKISLATTLGHVAVGAAVSIASGGLTTALGVSAATTSQIIGSQVAANSLISGVGQIANLAVKKKATNATTYTPKSSASGTIIASADNDLKIRVITPTFKDREYGTFRGFPCCEKMILKDLKGYTEVKYGAIKDLDGATSDEIVYLNEILSKGIFI